MNSEQEIDVSTWSRYYSNHIHPFWWGIMILIAIECIVVAGFLSSYFYLWIVTTSLEGSTWPPSGTPLPPLLFPTLNTILLGVCAWSMYYGGKVMEQGDNRKFTWLVVLCSVAGLTALFFRGIQFSLLPFDWKKNAYTSFVWTITGFHFLHLLSAILGTIVIGLFSARGYYTKTRRLGVQVDTLYWYFVCGVWVPLYLLIYWTPRWLGVRNV